MADLKPGLAALALALLAALAAPASRAELTILNYHEVHADPEKPSGDRVGRAGEDIEGAFARFLGRPATS